MIKVLIRVLRSALVSYLFVGGAATLVEWGCFYLFASVLSIHYLMATALAYLISTFSNWLFGRLWTWKDAARQNLLWEIGKIYATAVGGLLLNLLLMWILVEELGAPGMHAKILSTVLVFAYNYLIRKKLIYRDCAR